MGMAALPGGTTVPSRQEALSTEPGLRGLETQQLQLGDPPDDRLPGPLCFRGQAGLLDGTRRWVVHTIDGPWLASLSQPQRWGPHLGEPGPPWTLHTALEGKAIF